MSTLTFHPADTLRSLALAQPATIRVFESYHLDYCCGGARPLAQACAEKGLALDQVLADLDRATAEPGPARDLSQASATEVIAHIVSTHHAYVRAELPRLIPSAQKVAAKHGARHPEVIRVQQDLLELAGELTFHLDKEERILFPYVEALEAFAQGRAAAPHACFDTVQGPIQQMIDEHEAAGALLAGLRQLTANFTAPPDACPTFVGLYHGLDAFEHDLHRHIHLENNLLFPLAVQMEAAALLRR